MLGAIAGDIIGSYYEFRDSKFENIAEIQLFYPTSCFTDDSILTIAIADAIIQNCNSKPNSKKLYKSKLLEYGHRYPNADFGENFRKWLYSIDSKPYNSYGNGSAMRVSPIGFAYKKLEEVLKESKKSAEVTHNHREGIKGAKAIASAVYLAYNGESKDYIKKFIENKFGYNLNRRLKDIRQNNQYDSSCQGSVPEAIIAFLESDDFEDAVRKSISIGGDSDTLACMTGGIAQDYYKKIPQYIVDKVLFYLDMPLKKVLLKFNRMFNVTF
jgi:ADP-ribosylglycohydrolase